MLQDLEAFLEWIFIGLVAVVAFFLKQHNASMQAKTRDHDMRLRKLEEAVSNMLNSEAQLIELFKTEKAETRERFKEIKEEFRDMRHEINLSLSKQSASVDKIYDRIMNRPTNERYDDKGS